jgi:nucleoside triphosphate pyrophosphatase
MPDPTRLILASRSPRRAQLLREAGYRFTQADPLFDDPPQPKADGPDPAQALAMSLASQKALSTPAETGSIILAADTICVDADGQLIGQPADLIDARNIIHRFIGQSHRVITGVALLIKGQEKPNTLVDQARVTLGHLNPVQLNEYLATGQWQGKAGAYNLFDRQAAGWPLTVIGDPTTVVGLPMRKLAEALADLDVLPEPGTPVGDKR